MKKGSSAALRTCTSYCPFDGKNLPHPQFNYSFIDQSDIKENGIITNSDACCLSKLQVDCHIQCQKKKKKKKKKRYNSLYSSQSTKRSISSSSQLSSNQKRKKFDSSTNINSHYICNDDGDSQTSSSSLSTLSNTNESEITDEQSYSSNESKREHRYYNKSANAQEHHKKSQSRLHINQNIQNLKTSIDTLTQLIVHHQNPSQTTLLSNRSNSIPSSSFIDKFRRFFTLFKSSSKQTGDQINEECCQILKRNHLTKQNLLSIYHLFDKNEKIFLNWLRTIMPESFLPLLLNYVKHFDSISTDND